MKRQAISLKEVLVLSVFVFGSVSLNLAGALAAEVESGSVVATIGEPTLRDGAPIIILPPG